MIYAYNKDGTGSQGSGFVYNGYVITAKHVAEGTTKIDIFLDDNAYGVRGTIHYIDPVLDVAILKATTGKPSVTLGDSGELNEGEKIISITSPGGTQNLIDECINSGITQYDSGKFLTVSESSMDNGSSGGAIFNTRGEIVGIGCLGGGDGNLAIPVNDIKSILERIK
jgi:S1-C subfamily serine protease